ncbi:hypothetical protein F5Y15DRAFT_424033 [Xylariaceae sp. FL0016]|nr:hypothetical protein F5Y15DRAFT_424033 [Xylariaceae sp. FL0016]
MSTTSYPTLPATWTAPESCIGSTGYWYVVYRTVDGNLLFENMFGIPTPSQLSQNPSGTCVPPSFTSDVPYTTDEGCPTGYSAACAAQGTLQGNVASSVTCCPSGVFEFVCTENLYGCFSKPSGVQTWTGSRTDFAVVPPTGQIEYHTAGSAEGIHAWGIRMISTGAPDASSTPNSDAIPQPTTSSGIATSATTSSSPSASSLPNPGLSAGAAAGVGKGAALAVLLAALGAWALYRRRRKMRPEGHERQLVYDQGINTFEPAYGPPRYPSELGVHTPKQPAPYELSSHH